MIEFQTNIAMPPHQEVVCGRKPKYPWRAMPVGGSFFVAANKVKYGTLASLRTRIQRLSKLKFEIRVMTENNVNGWRVWRIK